MAKKSRPAKRIVLIGMALVLRISESSKFGVQEALNLAVDEHSATDFDPAANVEKDHVGSSLTSRLPGVSSKLIQSHTTQGVRAAWSALLVYARLGMLAKGKLLIEPKLRDSTPASLLMCAAIAGDVLSIQRILAEGTVFVDDINEAGETALMHAAVGGSVDALQARSHPPT